MNVSDAELMQKVGLSDKAAFRELYDRYQEDLYRLAVRKVREKAIAEEIVQDIFVGVWEKRMQLQITEIRGYLLRSVRNAVLDHIRAQAVRLNYARHYASGYDSSAQNSTDDLIALHELTTALNQGMETLSEKTREIFRFNRIDALSANEIATRLNMPQRTVEYHITLALRTLRERLKDFLPVVVCIGLF